MLALAITLFVPAPASATVEIVCQAVDGSDAHVAIGFGTLPVLNIISARIGVNGSIWTTSAGEGEIAILVGQAAHDGNLIIADFTDPNVLAIVASLRLLSASDSKDEIRIGTLRLTGQGVYGLLCEGP